MWSCGIVTTRPWRCWNKHPFKGLHTHYRGFPGKVSDVGIEGASGSLQVEITNATRLVNPMIISLPQLNAALWPHPLMSHRLTSMRYGAEKVTIQFSQDRMTAALVAVKCDDASNKRPVSWADVL